MAGLHNLRPEIIEPDPAPPTITLGTSSMDQLVGQLAFTANQGAESDNAEALAAWEERNRKVAAAINEVIQQENLSAE